MVFACSGTAVRLRHGYIQDPHTIFVTSARLAQEFNANRTKEDKLRIELRIPDKTTMHGYLGLHDRNIAIVTTFSLCSLYSLDMSIPCDPVNPPLVRGETFAFGCADDCSLMGIGCCYPVLQDNGFVKVDCEGKMTKIALGGPVICFRHNQLGHLAGVILGICEGNPTFMPTKMLNELLQRFVITSKTSHFRGYSLPEGECVNSVIPSGFMVRSKILQSLGYPLPPPLVFELNGGLAGTFEEDFGQYHYPEGYPFDYPNSGPGKPIWEQLGEQVTEKMSKSVVSIASFKEDVRFFACTGLLISWDPDPSSMFVLTSASLVRTGDAKDEIDMNLRVEVFLPPRQCVDGILKLYHPSYNIAIFSLGKDLTDISPVDISADMSSDSSAQVPLPLKHVVAAIGRRTKERHGLLMASLGKIAPRPKKKEHQGLGLNCQDLIFSTCKIKKVGIGGPLIGLNGKFVGMNFYDESPTTPFLSSSVIVGVLKRRLQLLSEKSQESPINVEMLDRPLTRNRGIRNRWPVSKPYWYLSGQADVLDQLGGKVPMY